MFSFHLYYFLESNNKYQLPFDNIQNFFIHQKLVMYDLTTYLHMLSINKNNIFKILKLIKFIKKIHQNMLLNLFNY